MKKILSKIALLIASLVISPCICMAWTDENIKKHYEDKFGTKYTDSVNGLRAIVYILGSKRVSWSIDKLQAYLEQHYVEFKEKFETVDMQEVENKCSELQKYYCQTQRNWQDSHLGHDRLQSIKALGNFDENMQKNRMAEIIKATEFQGENIARTELLSIAQIISEKTSVELYREAKRRKSVLLKWFDDNWDQILPTLQFVRLNTED